MLLSLPASLEMDHSTGRVSKLHAGAGCSPGGLGGLNPGVRSGRLRRNCLLDTQPRGRWHPVTRTGTIHQMAPCVICMCVSQSSSVTWWSYFSTVT